MERVRAICASLQPSEHSRAVLGIPAVLLIGFAVTGYVLHSKSMSRWPTWANHVGVAAGGVFGLAACNWCRRPAIKQPVSEQPPVHASAPVESEPGPESVMTDQEAERLVAEFRQAHPTSPVDRRLMALAELAQHSAILKAWAENLGAPQLWRLMRVEVHNDIRSIMTEVSNASKGLLVFNAEVLTFQNLLEHPRLQREGDLFALRPLVLSDAFRYLARLWPGVCKVVKGPISRTLAGWLAEAAPTADEARRLVKWVLDAWEVEYADSDWAEQARLCELLMAALNRGTDTYNGAATAIREYDHDHGMPWMSDRLERLVAAPIVRQ